MLLYQVNILRGRLVVHHKAVVCCVCPFCLSLRTGLKRMSAHMLLHQKIKCCTKCDMVFQDDTVFARHVTKCYKSCEVADCDKKFKNIKRYMIHKRMHDRYM